VARIITDNDAPDPRVRIPDYPPELARIVCKALARDRDQRYPSARALQLDLEAFAAQSGFSLSSALLADFMGEVYRDKLTFLRLVGADSSAPASTLHREGSWPMELEFTARADTGTSLVKTPGIVRRASEVGRGAATRVAPWVIPLICALASAGFTTWLLGR
jgi:hypothetical protein